MLISSARTIFEVSCREMGFMPRFHIGIYSVEYSSIFKVKYSNFRNKDIILNGNVMQWKCPPPSPPPHTTHS